MWTEFLASTFGFENHNWLYGFNGIAIAQILAFAPISFMILDGALKSVHPSIEEGLTPYVQIVTKHSLISFSHYCVRHWANSFLIVFIQSLADFSNPLVLR